MKEIKVGDMVEIVVGMEKGKIAEVVLVGEKFYTCRLENGYEIVKPAEWLELLLEA